NAKLRHEIVPSPPEQSTAPACDHAHARGAPARMSWARLFKRVFDIDIEHCSNCGGSLKIIAAIEDPPVIVKILTHRGLPTPPHWASPPPPRLTSRRSDSIYSKRLDASKTARQREPPSGTLSAFRPQRRPSRPQQNCDFHEALRRLTCSAVERYSSGQKKGG